MLFYKGDRELTVLGRWRESLSGLHVIGSVYAGLGGCWKELRESWAELLYKFWYGG